MSERRVKAKHSKVRTGCNTCKERRVKCDEARPSCRRCARAGYECEGYHAPKIWLFDATSSKAGVTFKPDIIYSPSWSSVLLPDDAARRSFDFYNDQAVPILAAYFGHSFWAKTLPQVSLQEGVVKEMILTTSSLIESNDLRLSLLEDNLVYHTNYRRVLKRMISDQPPSTEFVLMACIMLACCEFLQGKFLPGMQHIMSGVHILDEWYRSKYITHQATASQTSLILTELAPLFASIVKKIPTYGLALGVHPGMQLKLVPCREMTYVPRTFSNIHQARHVLEGIAHHVIQLMNYHHNVLEGGSVVMQLKDLLQRYREALDSYESQLAPPKRTRMAVWLSLLQNHHNVLKTVADIYPCVHGRRENYMRFRLEFASIVEGYQKYLDAYREEAACMTRSCQGFESLQFHAGMIPPLFFVATKSPDRWCRLAGISKLRLLRIQEGSWNSCVAATIAELYLDAEPDDITDGSQLLQDKKPDIPVCTCNNDLDWSRVVALFAVCGYQGAVQSISADCTCLVGQQADVSSSFTD